jgi:hypothetical protein
MTLYQITDITQHHLMKAMMSKINWKGLKRKILWSTSRYTVYKCRLYNKSHRDLKWLVLGYILAVLTSLQSQVWQIDTGLCKHSYSCLKKSCKTHDHTLPSHKSVSAAVCNKIYNTIPPIK